MCHSIASFALPSGPLRSLNLEIKNLNEEASLCFLEALAVDENLVDFDLNEVLAVALHLLVLLLALELEDEDLFATAFADDGGENLGSGEVGLELALFAADGEDVGELDVAVLVGGGFNLQLLARRDQILFAAGADDCVHD